MTINYKGKDSGFNFRIAVISFSESEQKLFDRMSKLLKIKGWNVEHVTDGYGLCEAPNPKAQKIPLPL